MITTQRGDGADSAANGLSCARAHAAGHTPGPWRWVLSEHSRSVCLHGGVPRYDLTVIDFVRWGMSGAAPRFRENVERMNIMHRCDEYGATVPGREHHADWFKTIAHPDALLIAAAPDLLDALRSAEEHLAEEVKDARSHPIGHCPVLDRVRAAIAKATGNADSTIEGTEKT